jgi:hypothetical protein
LNMTTNQLISYLVSIPKSVYFNFRVLPFSQAIKFPFFVKWNVRFQRLEKGRIRITSPLRPFLIAIGFNGTREVSPQRPLINLCGGTLIFHGKCNIAEGCIIDLAGGNMVFGKNFSANKNFFISCNKIIRWYNFKI